MKRSARVVRIVGTTISLGSRSYNAGDVDQCYTAYQKTALLLLSENFRAHLCPEEEEALRVVVELADVQASATRQAWTLRRALDELIRVRVDLPDLRAQSHWSRSYWSAESRAAPRIRISHSNGCSSDQSGSGSRTLTSAALPDELLSMILQSQLCGIDLARATMVCSVWKRLAPAVAEDLLRARRILPIGSATLPCWSCSLAAHEALTSIVGEKPERPWWREWAQLRVEEMSLSGQEQFAQIQRYAAGGECGIAVLLKRYSAGLEWMVQAGWPLSDAPACLLLPPYGSMAIARAIQDGTETGSCHRFGASVWAVNEVIRKRARHLSGRLPPAYASLHGVFGLATTDKAWLTLLEVGSARGRVFTTSTAVQVRGDVKITVVWVRIGCRQLHVAGACGCEDNM